MRVLMKAGCAAVLALLIAMPAGADTWNKKTFLTFSGPVQVPGMTLPAGTYTFKLADLSGSRHVVQIFDKDEKKIYRTILAIPDQRLEPSDKPVVLFAERPVGTPQAIKAWFYPGDTIGNEFVYPKSQAVMIAKATHTSVLATDEASTDSERMKSADVVRVDESGRTTSEAAPKTTASTRSQSVGTAGAARTELPRTASPLPLVGLLGALSLLAGAAVRRFRGAA